MGKTVANADATRSGKMPLGGKSFAKPRAGAEPKPTGSGPAVRRPGWSVGSTVGDASGPGGLATLRLPLTAVTLLHENSGIPLARIKQVAGVPEAPQESGRTAGPLPTDQAVRLARLSSVFEAAVSLFDGRVEDAREWLDTPLPVLDGKRPIDLARTDAGVTRVTDLVCRIEHGIVS